MVMAVLIVVVVIVAFSSVDGHGSPTLVPRNEWDHKGVEMNLEE